MTTQKIPKEGWVSILNSRKEHYIVERRSLCGNWLYRGSIFEQGRDGVSSRCASCKRKLKKRKEGT